MDEQNPDDGPTIRQGEPKPFEFAMGNFRNIEAISCLFGKNA